MSLDHSHQHAEKIGPLATETLCATRSIDIVVISLSTATERRRAIERQFSELPHDWSFFDAHTHLKHPDLSYDETVTQRTFGRVLSQQQLAVWSSHYTVITKFLNESDSDYLLVFEDDVIFDTAFPLGPMLDFCAEHEMHYMRLFGMYAARSRQLSFFFDRAVIRYASSPCGAQAYIVSKAGAQRLAATCRTVDTPVDLALDQFWKTGLPIYAVFPSPVIERFSPSSIPMQRAEPTSLSDKVVLTARRTGRRLQKLRKNIALRGRDREIRDTALDFVQVGQDHVRRG